MKKVLITGGAGFVGHHLIEHILKNTDWEITTLDRLDTSGNVERLRDIDIWEREKHRVKFFCTDLRAEINLEFAQMLLELNRETGALRPFDYIVHLAAGSHVDRSILDPLGFVMDNVVGTTNLLNFIRLYPALADDGKFLYFSTDEVFGPAPEGTAFKEWDRFNPNNPYAAAKAGGEDIAIAFAHTYRIPTIITHCMNIFGERQLGEKFIPICIRKILKGEPVTIHSNKDKTKAGTRFYLHTRNVCDVVLFLLKNGKCLNGKGTQGKYNIVGDQEVSNLEMAQLIAKYMGKELKYEMVDFHSSRPGHDLRYALDGSLLKEEGWIPPVDFEKSLERTIKWTIEHKDRWL
jgi:dTDP-glucose 4,6-dehydratase